MTKPNTSRTASELREHAEEELTHRPQESPASEGDLQRLLHELQVHQIELEMQKEELRNMYVALQESETRYRLLAELTSDCIFWTSSTGKMVYVSPACETLLGYGPPT